MKASAPATPKEDPAVKAQRDAAEARAQAERVRAIQDQLVAETAIRRRTSGMSSLLGSYGTSSTSLLGAG